MRRPWIALSGLSQKWLRLTVQNIVKNLTSANLCFTKRELSVNECYSDVTKRRIIV